MKIACDRCEKVIDAFNPNYAKEWRKIRIYSPDNEPNIINNGRAETINIILLCPECYDKAVDFLSTEYYQNNEKKNPPSP